jgi:hypothetical protein
VSDQGNELDEDFGPEQWTVETRSAVEAATDELVAAVRSHVQLVSGLRGGSSEMPAVFDANRIVEKAIDAWNERVFDYTGTFVVSLEGKYDEADDEGDELDDEDDPVAEGAALAVVSRWDLLVIDPQALVAAGREAHKRLRPEELDEDAEAAVAGVGQALDALTHERGELWYDLPGIEVVRGIRAYVAPNEPVEPFTDDVEEIEAPVVEPEGERVYLESWA